MLGIGRPRVSDKGALAMRQATSTPCARGRGGGSAHVGSIGDELAKEYLLLRVQRVDDDIHELIHISLELKLFADVFGVI